MVATSLAATRFSSEGDAQTPVRAVEIKTPMKNFMVVRQ
jgi:hypothetical protein